VWFFMRRRVNGATVGARHAVPLQLRHHRDLSISIEIEGNLGGVARNPGSEEVLGRGSF